MLRSYGKWLFFTFECTKYLYFVQYFTRTMYVFIHNFFIPCHNRNTYVTEIYFFIFTFYIIFCDSFSICSKPPRVLKGELSDSFTNYKNVGNTKVSVSIKKTYANKCTLSEIFLTKILKSFSVF